MEYIAKEGSRFHNYSANEIRKKQEKAGVLEYYTLKESHTQIEVVWENSFIAKLDKYLVNPIALNKSEQRAIKEWLDHQDKYYNKKFGSTEHFENINESLDLLFCETTKELIQEGVK
ncbi:hypothetical protein [Helicobacter pullorum]|uniref:hypothetical protein n=1 Tax=Helicobacter pullorum TaxID=35818 RepID=UPI00241E70D5|nr:hypothetical protein [Helicobacter pullorum]